MKCTTFLTLVIGLLFLVLTTSFLIESIRASDCNINSIIQYSLVLIVGLVHIILVIWFVIEVKKDKLKKEE